jgi:ankyrin repeat protein
VHESNVDLHLMDNEMKTALYYAITLEMHNILDILINKTDVNRVCHGLHEELPIFVASRLGKDRVLQSLLKSNADVNTLSSSGENALHFACKAGTVACSSLLIQTGIEINRKNLKNGRTPLIVAARMGHADCVQLLLEHCMYFVLYLWLTCGCPALIFGQARYINTSYSSLRHRHTR